MRATAPPAVELRAAGASTTRKRLTRCRISVVAAPVTANPGRCRAPDKVLAFLDSLSPRLRHEPTPPAPIACTGG